MRHLLLLLIFAGHVTAQVSTNTNTEIAGIEQRNASQVNASGSYTQNIIGQGSGNFDQGSIPTYERKGDVQCAVSSMSADAFALNNDASIGAFRLGISVPLTFGRCRDAFDDEVAVTRYKLHVAKVEQRKQDILFNVKLAEVCMGLHQAGIVIDKTNPLYVQCRQYMPSELKHGKPHPAEPNILGFGKPSAHAEEIDLTEHVHSHEDYPELK